MGRPSNRDQILTEGLKVVHARGFAGASVRDIVRAAGAPQGSFTNHFASKEAFGLEIIELYYARTRDLMAATLGDVSLAPLDRLRAYLDGALGRGDADARRVGCLFGNFAAEASDHSDAIRLRLVAVFSEIEATLADCLRAAVAAGELPAGYDCEAVAGFILTGLQGAALLAKAQRSPVPAERLRAVLFEKVLR